MKQYIAALFVALGLCPAVLGGPGPIFPNNGIITNPPVVDEVTFSNAGIIKFSTEPLPYMTMDTLYYINTSSGYLVGFPGFQFDTGSSTSLRHSAASFFNQGTVYGVDIEGSPVLWVPIGSAATTPGVPVPSDSQPYPSLVQVQATNILNTGIMSVGNCGALRLMGINVTNNSYAKLTAGSVATAGSFIDPLDTTGLEGQQVFFDGAGVEYYTGSPGVYDLFWGASNAQINVAQLAGNPSAPFTLPSIQTSNRVGTGNIIVAGIVGGSNVTTSSYPFTLNPNPPWSVSVYSNAPDSSNTYYTMVFVNTSNLASQNISASVAFRPFPLTPAFLQVPPKSAYQTNGPEAVVQFIEPVLDIITDQMVTNGVYLLDDGAYLNGMSNVYNASSPDNYHRPNAFELTTETPSDWLSAVPSNAIYDPTVLSVPQEFVSNTPPIIVAEYGAQIGRNPALLSGSFNPAYPVLLPDPTNEPGRIEIDAGNLDITSGLLRAEGMVVLNVTNLAGLGTAGVDWGQVNATIGVNSGSLLVSNVFPSAFQRLRGDIFAYSASWQNTQTNTAKGNTNNPNNTITNLIHYHLLVVDQNLAGSVLSTERNLNLTGTKSIVLQDSLNVINQFEFNTANLTINSNAIFSQNAGNFMPTNTPSMKNLLINTNGFLEADNMLNVGYNQALGVTSAAGRNYTVNTITNFGVTVAATPLLESGILEHDGTIYAAAGSMILEANQLGLGLAQPEATNLLVEAIDDILFTVGDLNLYGNTNLIGTPFNLLLASGNVNLSANTIQARNSIIETGFTNQPGSITLEATSQLTDLVSGIPTTNTNSVITNYWVVTGGLSMPVKPATGDLFGTEIHSISSGNQQATHVWAGLDMGSNLSGGNINNQVIGHLLLDQQTSNSIMRFKAAGVKNAMYVDYLELANFAASDHNKNLIIDPNFTIYFANCNVDPAKINAAYYPRLVWMTNFVGPNSAVVVPYLNSTNFCLINAGVAQSSAIAFFPPFPNSLNQPSVLNDPNNPANTLPCPKFVMPNPVTNPVANSATNPPGISLAGRGAVSPIVKPGQLVGSTYTLTANPKPGWVFENWTVSGLVNPVNTNSRVIQVTFGANTSVKANFMLNPFGPLHGVYNGLFFETNGVNPASSGAFTLTLQASGFFSGRLLMGPKPYHFSSQFAGDGAAQVQAVNGAQKLTVNLQLDMSGSGQIQGDVTNAGIWDAPLEANIAPTWTVKNPSPLQGSYTMVMPWGTTNEVGGDSYAAGKVSRQGVLTLAGALADGVPFSASAPVSQSNQWPFYVYAASGKDSVLGWVSVSALDGLIGTNVIWVKPPGKGPLYPAGLTNAMPLVGSPWQAPAKQTDALNLNNPAVILSGGNLAEPLTNAVTLLNYLTYTGMDLTLSIRPSTGAFNGSFERPDTGRKQSISGVVLQNANNAQGFFIGADESGSVLLQSQ